MTGIANRLISLVAALHLDDLKTDYEQFCNWTQWFGDVTPFPEHECGKLSMSPAEQKWVVLDALVRHAAGEADNPDFHGQYLVDALSGNGFAPSFEVCLLSKCESAWNEANAALSAVPAFLP